jgi:hypothetical protein
MSKARTLLLCIACGQRQSDDKEENGSPMNRSFRALMFVLISIPVSICVFLSVLGAMLLALSTSAAAQQSTKVHRIEYLSSADAASDSARAEGVRLALRELGYVEGQNIAFEFRYGHGAVLTT